MRKLKSQHNTKLRRHSFLYLVKKDQYLASLRQEFASKSAEERRMAADWHYHSSIASEMFELALACTGGKDCAMPHWPAGVLALTIDPLYAPALLTVGSLEYLYGRPEEAMSLFMKLTCLRKDEDDLAEIIDKAGDFLLDQEDYENALQLYLSAEKLDPEQPIYLLGSGYCLGKLGRFDESVEKHRQVVAMEPENYKHLNDLGYSLLEAGKFEEAEEMLKKSLVLAPSDYKFPKNNLEELYERKRLARKN